MFTEKQYDALADFFATNCPDRNFVVRFANWLQANNPNFNETRFLLKSAPYKWRGKPSSSSGWDCYDGLD